MLSFVLRREIEKLLTSFKVADQFIEFVRSLSCAPFDHLVADVVAAHPNAQSAGTHLQNELSRIHNSVNQSELFKIVGMGNNFKSALINASLSSPALWVDDLIAAMDTFMEALQSLVQLHAPKAVVPVILSGRNLHSLLSGLESSLKTIRSNLQAPTEDSNQVTLSLVLPLDSNLIDFAQKLFAINNLYGAYCELFEINANEDPVRIVKIESGSLWIEIAGNAPAILFITGALSSAAAYLYKNFTTDGKLSRLPKNIEALNSMLDLRNKLDSSGINVATLDNRLEKSAAAIGDSLATLLEDQASIEINGKHFDVGGKRITPMLEAPKAMKQIEDKSADH